MNRLKTHISKGHFYHLNEKVINVILFQNSRFKKIILVDSIHTLYNLQTIVCALFFF